MRRLRFSSIQLEWLLAVALTLAFQLEYRNRFSASEVLVGMLITLPVGLRLRLPLPVVVVVVGGIVGEAALGRVNGSDFPVFPIISLAVALAAVGARCRWPSLLVAAAVSLGGWFTAAHLTSPHGNYAVGLIVTAVSLLLGRAVGVLRFESDTFAERTAELERERDERARAAVEDERRRIARELHDVIGHSISVMGVQAGAVRSVLAPGQERERDALLRVERIGREAIAEMRRLIGLLRPDESPGTEATATLRSAPRLADQMRAAGMRLDLDVRGDLTRLPAGLDLAGYRILQEGLTNVLRHARGSAVKAMVCIRADRLELRIVNDHQARDHAESTAAGHGLIGMRERAALYGGEICAGPTGDGRYFELRASLPLDTR